MIKRGISEAEIEAVLAAPDSSYPSGTSDCHVYVRNLGDRRIAVVVAPDDHERVVTVYNQLAQAE